jgi:hypothetical protein
MPEPLKEEETMFNIDYQNDLNVWNFKRILTQKYDVVVTNPPYMGSSGMNAQMLEFVKKNYPDSKSDLFAVFIEKCGELLKPNGSQAMITQHAWMFLSSYEKLRSNLLLRDVVNMAHLGAKAFEEIGGEVVQTTAFVMSAQKTKGYAGTYVRLVDFGSQNEKEKEFLTTENRYTAAAENFAKIPESPVAYWVSKAFIENFEKGISIGGISDFTGSQHKTADNDKYLRMFWEISNKLIKNQKWIFYIKGGEFRKWYGNIDLIVDWSDSARKFYGSNLTSNMIKEKYHFQEGITYTSLTSSVNGFRYLPPIGVFDIKGPSIVYVQHLYYCLSVLNSKVSNYYFKLLNPTVTLQVRDVNNFPIIIDTKIMEQVETLGKENVDLCKIDWDSFETSWDFKRHPLI